MAKKIIAACVALVALAAFPSMALAVHLEEAGSVLVKPGAKIQATSEETSIFTGGGGLLTVECKTSKLTGEVTKSELSGSSAEGKITSASYFGAKEGEACSSNIGSTTVNVSVSEASPWCMVAGTKDIAEIHGGTCGSTGTMTFSLVTPLGTCKYTAEKVVSNTFTTGTIPGTVKFASQTFNREEGGSFCPTTGVFTGSYTFETDGTTTGIGIFSS